MSVPFDAAAFWVEAWKQANLSLIRAPPVHAADMAQLDALPRVFVYELPPPFSDFDPSSASVDDAFGTITNLQMSNLTAYDGVQMRDTSGYAFATMLHYRLWHSRVLRTTEPSTADLFFVPLLTAPKRRKLLNKACDAVARREAELPTLLPHLNPRTAHRHFVVVSKEHALAANCSGWFTNPVGLLSSAMRIAYSHVQPDSLRASQTDFGAAAQYAEYCQDPNHSYPHLHSVHFPTSVHAVAAEPSSLLEPWRAGRMVPARVPWGMPEERRKRLAAFVGTDEHGDVEVRKLLTKSCKAMSSRRCVVASFAYGLGMVPKGDAYFCLEPAGDSPYRKSLADSIAMGCVPVLFHPMTDNANEWVWGGWKEASRVLVPRDAFLRREVHLGKLLSSIPEQLLALYRRTIALHGRKFQISLFDDVDDSVAAVLRGLQAELGGRQAEYDASTESGPNQRHTPMGTGHRQSIIAKPQHVREQPSWYEREQGDATALCNSSSPSLHQEFLGVCSCECVFVDVGLNNGDTLRRWWRPLLAKGLLQQGAGQQFRACAARPASAHCYYGFEANPRWSARLGRLEQQMRLEGLRVKLFTGTALSTADGVRTFYTERDTSSLGVDSSLEAQRAEHYKDRSGKWRRNNSKTLSNSDAFKAISVQTVDAGRFFDRLVASSAMVAVKIDIEGSEYSVLRHVLLTHPRALCKLAVLAVEWHESLLVDHEASLPSNMSQAFKWMLSGNEDCNVSLLGWH